MGSPTSLPTLNLSLLPAAQVTAYTGRRDIIFGQLGASATAVSGALNTGVEALTTAEIKTKFGTNVFLTNCILQWKATNGSYSLLDVIGLDPAAGTEASGTIEFTGPATSDGTLYVTIVDEYQYRMEIAVTSGDSATDIGDAIDAAVLALTDPVFTSSNAAGTVTFTAVDKGTIGNAYGIKVDGKVPGVGYTITAFASGATDPTLTSILDNIAGIRYTGMMWPQAWYSSLSIPKAELESRFNASNALMDGTCFTGMVDTYANIITALGSQNSKCIVTMGCPKLNNSDHKGPAVLKPADWVAAEFMGIRARRMSTGAPISDYIVTTSGTLDVIGGASLASLPYFNTPLAYTPVTSPTNLFSQTEQAALEAAGFTVYGVNSALSGMIMGPVVTNWITDAGGNVNTSFKYLNYVDTGSVCREVFFAVLKAVFSQSRLTEGDLIAGRSMTNADGILATLLRIYGVLANAALTQKGRTAESYFKQNTAVTVTLSTRSASITGPLPIVTQLEEINYPLQLAFTVGSTGTEITL